MSGIANIPQKRHQTVRQIRLQMEHISMRSCIHTKWNQLSPRQTAVAVCRQSDGSDGQTGSLWGFLSDEKNSEHFHAFLSPDIQHSTVPHQPTAGGPPFLSRAGNVLHASHLQGFCILTFHKRTFCFTPAIPTGFHSSEPKAHLSYTLSSASVIPAGIIHSVFVPRLPVMVSLFHTPLAE